MPLVSPGGRLPPCCLRRKRTAGRAGRRGSGRACRHVLTVQASRCRWRANCPGSPRLLIAELRPQVTGIVSSACSPEGSEVKAARCCLPESTRHYQAAHDSARPIWRGPRECGGSAAEGRALRRSGEDRGVSKQANDEAPLSRGRRRPTSHRRSRARQDEDRPPFTRVSSPIAGRISARRDPGALVTQPAAALVLCRSSTRSMSTDAVQRRAAAHAAHSSPASCSVRRNSCRWQLVLEDGSLLWCRGQAGILGSDGRPGHRQCDAARGVSQSRGELLPGMYVRARLTQGVNRTAMLVPHRSGQPARRGRGAGMVVDADSKVEARIPRRSNHRDKWVVTEGLAAGDRSSSKACRR